MPTPKRTIGKSHSSRKKSAPKPSQPMNQVVRVTLEENGREVTRQIVSRGHFELDLKTAPHRNAPAAMSATPRNQQTDRQNLRYAVEQRLKNHNKQAWDSFRKLVDAKCDDGYLCDVLATIRFTYASGDASRFEVLFGHTRNKLHAVLKRLAECACDIDRLPSNILQDIPFLPPFSALRLPGELRYVANRLRTIAFATRERGRPHYDAAVAALIHYVKARTKRAHREDVINLVEAMRGDVYTLDAYKDWLKRNKPLVLNPWVSPKGKFRI